MKSKLSCRRYFAVVAGFLFLAIGWANGQTVVNGSFETGISIPGISIELDAVDSTSLNGWTVTSGSIDYVRATWPAGDGIRSLDLTGSSAGTIEQVIGGFTIGQAYQLSFLMAGNPEGGPQILSLRASIGSASQIFTFDTTGHSDANLGWVSRTMNFTATAGTLALDFAGQQNGLYGATLDKVAITPVPEPGTLALVSAALVVGLGATARRRAKH